jgi:hypothetical protein
MHFAEINFKAVDGNEYSLADVSKDKEALVIVFTSVQCPYALAYFDRLERIATRGKYSNIGFILVNSNASIEEDVEDLEEMKKQFPSLSVPFIRDEEKVLANHFEATFTPECLLLDKQYAVLYRGPVDGRFKTTAEWSEDKEGFWPWDDNPPSEPEVTYIEQILDEFISSRTVPFADRHAIGCTIK